MSLLDEFSKEYCMMTKQTTSDGEGGFVVSWVEGATFSMPEAHDVTIAAQIAEQEKTASTYYFLPGKNLTFDFHDVFKRKTDGAIFRVTSPSGEKVTPGSSSLNRTYIKAERWILT